VRRVNRSGRHRRLPTREAAPELEHCGASRVLVDLLVAGSNLGSGWARLLGKSHEAARGAQLTHPILNLVGQGVHFRLETSIKLVFGLLLADDEGFLDPAGLGLLACKDGGIREPIHQQQNPAERQNEQQKQVSEQRSPD
jgi:hypothetical protein